MEVDGRRRPRTPEREPGSASRPLLREDAARSEKLAARRLAREPVARIVGFKEFWGLEIRVGVATLVPRPETETVVEAALALVDAGGGRTRSVRIADLGTGSGALLLALLSELPSATAAKADTRSREKLLAASRASRSKTASPGPSRAQSARRAETG